jgi:hypothetical protein
MNEMTIMKQSLDIKEAHFRVRWLEFVHSLDGLANFLTDCKAFRPPGVFL